MEINMKKINLTKILFALVGILFVGIGVAFNAATQLGNDPIGIIYDGIRNVLGLEPGQLGLVSNGINFTLIVLLFFVGRRYINLGTIIYILPFGFFVTLGTQLYNSVLIAPSDISRYITGLIGCLLIYTGVSIFIAMDMGLDPFTGIVMVLSHKLNIDFKKVKIAFDLTMVLLGVLLGGKLGVITIFTALTAGPSIQWISGKIIHFMNAKRNLDVKEYSL
jgi:uncharacterized membrane protein YczE